MGKKEVEGEEMWPFLRVTNVKSERKNWGPMGNTFPRPFCSSED